MEIALLLLVMSCYAALAWLNCAAIDRWESGAACNVAKPGLRIGAAAGLFAMACLAISPRVSALAAACAGSAFLLAVLDRERSRLTPLALRCSADLVLLTPIVCLMR